MTVGIGQVLKLLDMIPDKKGRRTFIEKLPSAQKLDGGNLTGLMAKVAGGDLASLFKDPLAAIMGPLQQLLGAVMGSQSSDGSSSPGTSSGANAFTAAVGGPGGLSDAVQALSAQAGRLSGTIAPAAGEFGFTDLVLHEGVLDQLGESAPDSMSLAVVAAPLMSGDLLSRVADTVYRYNVLVIRNQMTPEVAASDIVSFTAQINAIVSASNSALSQGEAMAPGIAQVQTAAGALVAGTSDLQKLVRTCLQPSSASAMDAAMKDRLTIRPPDPDPPANTPATSTKCY